MAPPGARQAPISARRGGFVDGRQLAVPYASAGALEEALGGDQQSLALGRRCGPVPPRRASAPCGRKPNSLGYKGAHRPQARRPAVRDLPERPPPSACACDRRRARRVFACLPPCSFSRPPLAFPPPPPPFPSPPLPPPLPPLSPPPPPLSSPPPPPPPSPPPPPPPLSLLLPPPSPPPPPPPPLSFPRRRYRSGWMGSFRSAADGPLITGPLPYP